MKIIKILVSVACILVMTYAAVIAGLAMSIELHKAMHVMMENEL